VVAQTQNQLEVRIGAILLEYAQAAPTGRPLEPSMSLRNDRAIESLSLVSVVLRIGDEFGVDIASQGDELELSRFETVGDMLRLARQLQDSMIPVGEPVH
jgi:acyl carrier protein